MKSRLLFAAGLALCSLAAAAKDITPSQAKAIAAKYVNVGQAKKASRFKAPSATAAVAPDFYVFNDVQGKGFVLIAGDDCVTPVLGYSHTGELDQDNMAPALKAWLDGVSADIVAKRAGGGGVAPTAEGAAPTADDSDAPTVVVAPLVKTQWNQKAPYYDQTPLVDGRQSMTGCVATALAQVMRYYQWPVTGTGSVHYDTPSFDTKTMDVDFSQSTYDWANMRETYVTADGTPQWNEAEGKAVAHLMKDIGAAIHMNYHYTSSGSWGNDIPNTVSRHFGYDAVDYKKSDYCSRDWVALIERQLDGSTPLVYAAQSAKNGGHEFVIDGYDSRDYLHVNWGWSGSGDGYYTFANFGNPNFNQYMSFVVMKPNKSGTPQPEVQTSTLVSAILSKDGTDTNSIEGDKADFAAHIAVNMQHASWKPLDALMRYALKDAQGNIAKTWGDGTVTTESATVMTTVTTDLTGADLDGLADGTYYLTVQLKDKRTDGTRFDDWDEIDYATSRVVVTIDGSRIAMANENLYNAPVVVKSMTLDKATVYMGETLSCKVSLDTSNGGDNLENPLLVVLKSTDDDTKPIVILGDATISVFGGLNNEFTLNFDVKETTKLSAGNYVAYLYAVTADDYTRLEIPGGPVPVEIKLDKSLFCYPYIDSYSLQLDGDEGKVDCDLSDGKVIDVDLSDEKGLASLIFNFGVKWAHPATAKPTAPYSILYQVAYSLDGHSYAGAGSDTGDGTGLNDSDSNVSIDVSVFDELFEEANYGKTLSWSFYSNVPYSEISQPMAYKDGSEIIIKTYLHDSTLGISDITTKAQPTERFDIQGRRIAAPAKGLNIVRMSDGKVKKFMVK